MKSILLTGVKLVVLGLFLSACAVTQTKQVYQIALLAPFEGRYREVGYNALYSTRLAIAESGLDDLELLALDDGGSVETATERARGLANQQQVVAVLVLGYSSTASSSQQAFADLPVLVAGHWGILPETEHVFVYANSQIGDYFTVSPRIEVTETENVGSGDIGGDVFTLSQFRVIHTSPMGIRVVTSAELPNEAFYVRYRASDQFAPEPQLVAVMAYEATTYLLGEISHAGDNLTRDLLSQALSNDFTNGFLTDAPLYFYEYGVDNALIPIDSVIEEG